MKKGVVLSGGGARGAYQIGVAKALKEAGILQTIDAFSGVSVGSLNAVLLASGALDKAERLWLEMDTDMVFKADKSFISKLFSEGKNLIYNGYYDTDVFRRMIDENLSYEKIMASEIYVAVSHVGSSDSSLFQLMTVNMRDFFAKEGLIRYRPLHKLPLEDIKKTLIASCAIPVVFRPVVIGDDTYYDGGMLDNAPYQPLVDAGCKEIFLIDLFRMKLRRHHVPADVTLHVIRPSRSLRGILDFSTKHIMRRFELGYTDGQAFVKSYSNDQGA